MPSKAHIVFTDRSHGDFAVGLEGPSPGVLARRRALVDRPWSWLRQVHGGRVVTVRWPGDRAGEEADALVTRAPDAVLAVHVADCAPVALTSPEGVLAAVHAGWRGLEAGVIERAVAEMHALGASSVTARVGPCIGPECYEFGVVDLDRLAARLGESVRGLTAGGKPALDVAAAVRAALHAAQVEDVSVAGVCTACSPAHFSHRARAEAERHALAVWSEA